MSPAVATLTLLLCASAAVALKLPPWQWNDMDNEASHKVSFEFYSRENRDTPGDVVTVSDLPDDLESFDPQRPTKVLVHGWHGRQAHAQALKKAFLKTSDVNVVIANWHGVDTLVYPVAVKRVPAISRQLADLVQYLVKRQGMRLDDLHIVGHSLGAHISGLAANYIPGTINRITGLDPAGPLFKTGADRSLSKTHAAFVDIIHTCANVFGFHDAMGHVDFYPNGGVCFQPGCAVQDMTTGKCSHNRAYYLFEESILLNDTLLALPAAAAGHGTHHADPCSEVDTSADTVPMGLSTPRSARGVFCLSTRAEEPFGYGAESPIPMMVKPTWRQTASMWLKFLRLKMPHSA
ncbi:lipase member H-A-like isoform X1 [Frankliniella occidentalis]|uniref:Lipase member H-A-like isoform X1 n=1 Tax=Frankliniella occidentalis TaxID=133901 RepID=A0A6J1S1S0_FRAOC|nr:lipase member H-A-like isoform X1 [Frankliniella occidentalis]